MAQGFKITTTDHKGNKFQSKGQEPAPPKISHGHVVARTDADGTEYTEDGLRIEGDYDTTEEDQHYSKSLAWASCKLTIPGAVPNAWKLDTNLAQVYEIQNFMTAAECDKTIDIINSNLVQSGVTGGSASTYRTSRTGHMEDADVEWAQILDYKMSAVLGVDPRFSEGIQGQRYDQTQYFKEHTDWFDEDYFGDDDDSGLETLGQRTWSFMVYLNDVPSGGETFFRRLNRTFHPRKGTAVVWNNIWPDGRGNPFTVHEAMPVKEGHKWVITKWFRMNPNPDLQWLRTQNQQQQLQEHVQKNVKPSKPVVVNEAPSTGSFVVNLDQPK